MKKALKAKQRSTVAAGVGAVLACLLLMYVWAATKPATSATLRERGHPLPARVAGAHQVAMKGDPAGAESATGRRYETIFSRNLFRPAGAVQTRKQGALPPMPLEAFELPGAGGQKEAQQPQWVYAGYATVDGRPVAIIENAQTKAAEFLGVGDKLEGFALREISPSAVQLARAGETRSLRISDAFTATPLNEPPKPGRSTTGGQGRQGFGGGFLNSGLFQNVIMPALRDNPQYADEARQLMRNFGGGFGGRRRGGFGGSGQPAIPEPAP